MLPYLLCFQNFQNFYAKPNRVISFFVVLVVGEIQIAEPPTVMQSGIIDNLLLPPVFQSGGISTFSLLFFDFYIYTRIDPPTAMTPQRP